MARINIAGFYGFGNSGDEGILRAMIESLGKKHTYIVSTTLPHEAHREYLMRFTGMPVGEIRHVDDIRTDYDLYIQGGGGLGWCFGWKQMMSAVVNDIPCMNYGVGYYPTSKLYSKRVKPLYREWLKLFDRITVRDGSSVDMLRELGADPTLTGDPAINLNIPNRDPFLIDVKDKVLICPRYEDFGIPNDDQIKWLSEKASEAVGSDRGELLLVAFAPYDGQRVRIDLALCDAISKRLGGGIEILNVSGFIPHHLKYAFSKCSRVISGGRYHAGVWAIAYDKPFEFYPPSLSRYPKNGALFFETKGVKSKYLKLWELENACYANKLLDGK